MPIEINGKQTNVSEDIKSYKLKAYAVFRVLSPPLRAKTEEGMIERAQASSSYPSTYTKMNADGSYDTVRYYGNKTPHVDKNGNTIFKYDTDFVMIENGEIRISTVTNGDLYWWWRNHPHNLSNPAYDKEGKSEAEQFKINEIVNNRNVPFEFYEVDKRKGAKGTLALERLREQAKGMVLAEDGDEGHIDEKQLVLLCKAYNMAEVDECIMVGDYDTLRNNLLAQATVDPAGFMKKTESAALGMEATVNDAVALNVIVYDQPDANDGIWAWGTTTTEIKPKKIMSIPAHQFDEKVQLLMDFLRMDAAGTTVSKRLKSEVTAARKAKLMAAV